jgi:putative transposase
MQIPQIKRECGKWYAIFAVECEAEPLPPCAESVGIDVGLTTFAMLSDGTEIPNPRYYREAQAELRRAARKVARRKKGSHRRRKAVALLRKVHVHIRSQRADFHHKISRWLVNNYGLIAVEDLNIKGLAKSMLAKSVNDAGWGLFLDKIAYKAEDAARVFVRANPAGSSQECLCGAEVRKTLKERWHSCESCGLSAPRDHVSAQLILRRAVRRQVPTWPVAAGVA